MSLFPAGMNIGSGISVSGGTNILLIGSLFAGGGLIIVLGFLLIRNLMSYKIPINIWTRIGSGAVFEQDKGKILYNKETKRPEGLKFRRKKVIEEYPSSDYFHPNDKGRPILNAVIADNKVSFFRIEELMPKSGDIKTKWTQNDLHGTFYAVRRNAEKFEVGDFLSKYGVLIGTGLLTIVVLIFMIVVFQKMDSLGHTFAGIASNVAKSATTGGLQ